MCMQIALSFCLPLVVVMAAVGQTNETKATVAVPAVTGLSAAEARALIQSTGLIVKFELGRQPPSNDKALSVYAQDPAAGEKLGRGSIVFLTVYAESSQAGPGKQAAADSTLPAKVEVPAVIGRSAKDAKAALAASGLAAKFQLGPPQPSPGKGLGVAAQDPAPGSSVAPGSVVLLTVYGSSGTNPQPELCAVRASPALPASEESIDPRSGTLSLTATDLVVPAGPVRLDVTRSFQTQPGPNGLLGSRWQLNWERRLVPNGKKVSVIELAQVMTFELDERTQRYRSAAGDSLAFQDDRAIWRRTDGATEIFDNQGRLIERDEPNGSKIVLRYNSAGRLERVDGPFGSFLKLAADAAGRLVRIESSRGGAVEYFYSNQSPAFRPAEAGQTVSYAYDATGAVSQINHTRFGETRFAYDSKERVTNHRWADGAEERFEYDDANNIRRWIDPTGAVTTTRISPDGRRIDVIDPLNRKSAIELDASGRPLVLTGPTRLQARFTYDALGRPVSIQNPATGTTNFEYLEDTRLPVSVTAPDGKLSFTYDARHNLLRLSNDRDKTQSAEFEYSPDGLVKSVKTGDGQMQSFTYDDAGRRASVTDTAGNKWQFKYDGRGNLLSSADPLGGITKRSYDAHGRLVRVTDPAGGSTRWEYAELGCNFEITETDNRGGITRSVYDRRGRLVSRTGPGEQTTRYNYNAAGRLTSLTSDGQTYRFEHDAGGNLLKTINPLGGITAQSFDAMGRVTSITDPAGATEIYEFSPTGLLCKSMDPTGRPTQYKHDGQGRLLAAIDDAEQTTGYEYAASGRVRRIVPPSGQAFDFTYDDFGRLASVRRGQQVLVSYEYDTLGRRAKEKLATGLEISYRHDALGNLVAWEDNQGGSGKFEYDGVGRPVTISDASGATTRFKYDPAGKWAEMTSPLEQIKRLAFDGAGRLSEVVEPNGDKARYEYDSAGRVTAAHLPAGGTSRFDYDALGMSASVTDPLGGRTRSVHDAAGRLVSTTDAKNQTTKFIYDAAGRLSEKRLADQKVLKYGYDSRGNLSAVDDCAFPVRYTRDSHGRLTGIEYPAIKRRLTYEYNEAGLRTAFIDSEGHTIRYEYDEFDRLSALKYDDRQAIVFGYDAKDRLTSTTYPNGVKEQRQYDANDRAVKMTYTNSDGNAIAGWTYAYDAGGNCTQCLDADGRTTRYRYDPADQLTEEIAGDGASVKYSYLPGGNRETRSPPGGATRYRYDQADRLLEAGQESFAHDANGNLVERKGPKGTTRYRYDAEDRLVKVTLPGGSEISYGYAPTGERVWRRDANGTTYFVTDGINLLAELTSDLKPRSTYLHGAGIDRPLLMSRDGQEYCLHADRLGSVSRITDRRGTVAGAYEYDAFGQIQSKNGKQESPFTYTGREFDAAAGLYYYRARYYDAGLGRFLNKDPVPAQIYDSLSLNPYPYVQNNPVRFVDRMGQAKNKPQSREGVQGVANFYLNLPNGRQPRVVAQLQTMFGTFNDRSNYSGPTHPVVEQLNQRYPDPTGNLPRCAERGCYSQALYRHEQITGQPVTNLSEARQALAGSTIQTAIVDRRSGRPLEPYTAYQGSTNPISPVGRRPNIHGSPIDPCEPRCDPISEALGVDYVGPRTGNAEPCGPVCEPTTPRPGSTANEAESKGAGTVATIIIVGGNVVAGALEGRSGREIAVETGTGVGTGMVVNYLISGGTGGFVGGAIEGGVSVVAAGPATIVIVTTLTVIGVEEVVVRLAGVLAADSPVRPGIRQAPTPVPAPPPPPPPPVTSDPPDASGSRPTAPPIPTVIIHPPGEGQPRSTPSAPPTPSISSPGSGVKLPFDGYARVRGHSLRDQASSSPPDGETTPCDLPEIPPACPPGILDLLLGLLGDPAGVHLPEGEGSDGCDELGRKLDHDLTIIAEAVRLNRALTAQQIAAYQANLARYRAALQQQAARQALAGALQRFAGRSQHGH
jgi:RHS repeat-associated protein